MTKASRMTSSWLQSSAECCDRKTISNCGCLGSPFFLHQLSSTLKCPDVLQRLLCLHRIKAPCSGRSLKAASFQAYAVEGPGQEPGQTQQPRFALGLDVGLEDMGDWGRR